MIVTETIDLFGIDYKHTYSDAGYKIRQDDTGVIYDDAVDPIDSTRTYTETDIPIDDDGTGDDPAEASDYEAALERLGVVMDD